MTEEQEYAEAVARNHAWLRKRLQLVLNPRVQVKPAKEFRPHSPASGRNAVPAKQKAQCRVSGCHSWAVNVHGMCSKHYQRWRVGTLDVEGLVSNPRKRQPKRSASDMPAKIVYERMLHGETAEQIGKSYGFYRDTVYACLRRAGLPTPRPLCVRCKEYPRTASKHSLYCVTCAPIAERERKQKYRRVA